MEKNLGSLYDKEAANYFESRFDEAPDNSFDNDMYDADADGLMYDRDALQYDQDADGMHYEAPDNLFGIAIGKRARHRKALRQTRAELDYNRKMADMKLEQIATDKQVAMENVALDNVQKNQPLVAAYVSNSGQTPQQNPAALALQATSVFQNQIEQKQAMGVPDYDTAYDSVIQDQQEQWGNEEADEFFGAILSSVFQAGKALLEKINANREANGKKPLFAGKNWHKLANKVNGNQSIIDDALSANERAFLALTKQENQKASAVSTAVGAFADDQRNAAIKQYLPFALILLVVVFFMGKKL